MKNRSQFCQGCDAQWLRQGHCRSLSRATSALRALATRVRQLESLPAFSGLWDCAKALVCEHLAMEVRDLGIQFRLDYGSRPLHTSDLDSSRAYVGLKNLGNSC